MSKSVAINTGPRGRTFIRGVLVADYVAKHGTEEGLDLIERRWGELESVNIHKAAVSAFTLDTDDYAAREFLNLVLEQSAIGKLQGRRVPFNVRTLRMTTGARGYWVGQGKPVPVSKPALTGSVLMPLKVGVLVVLTKESTQPGGLNENTFQTDMQRAISDALDEAFLDVANAGIADEMPAAITYGATEIPAGMDPAWDMRAMIEAFAGDLSMAAFVTDPLTATKLAMTRDEGGNYPFPDAGPRGGSILGIPLIVTRGSPLDSNGGQIALIDASGLAMQVDSIAITKSEVASLQMSDTPTDGAAELVSLWQTNSVAFMAMVSANWENQRTGGVVVLTNVTYDLVP